MDEEAAIVARRRKLHLLAKRIGLTTDDRHALAEMLLRRDVSTWAGMSDADVCRLLDALEGYGLVLHLTRHE